MADWNQPTITTNYLAFVTEMHAKFTDAAQMFGIQVAQNFPTGTLRFNRPLNLFDEWDGAAFQPKILSIAGGGTGSNNIAGIKVNLGLGSMATQNANAVAITGGTITGVTYSASDINTGVMALARGGTGASLALGQGGYILMSNGSSVFFDSGANISQLNASNLASGSIPVGRMPPYVAYLNAANQGWGGTNTFSDTIITSYGAGINNFSIRSVYPLMNWNETENTAGTKNMRMIYSGGALIWQAASPDWSSSANVMVLYHGGQVSMYGGLITNLNASNIAAGRVHPAFLGTGPVGDTSTFLRGDGAWVVPPSGGGGGAPIPFPSGMISMFANGCPAGWTRVAQFDNRFPMGSTSYGSQGGNSNHSHSFSVNTSTEGNHSHSFNVGVGGRARGNVSGTTGAGTGIYETVDAGDDHSMPRGSHGHDFNVGADLQIQDANAAGETSQAGQHYHQVSGNTSTTGEYPPYTTVFFCQKD